MKTFSIPGASDSITLSIAVTRPVDTPKAILQMVHGMAEHKGRYIAMMEYLSERGYICVMNDLRGHGQTAAGEADLGYLDKGGWRGMVDDIFCVTEWIRRQYPSLPLYLFGHSMGSLIVREYCKEHDKAIDGLIVCGSPSANGAVGIARFLAWTVKLFKGPRHRSPLLAGLSTGAYNKKFRKEGSPNAWICSDPAVVEAYDRDPLCGFPFTANGYAGLFGLLQDVYSENGWKVENPSLPVHFIAGAYDPCIGSIAKFSAAVSFFRARGYRNVSSKVYPNMRHEIHNEAGKEAVWQDIAKTLDAWREK